MSDGKRISELPELLNLEDQDVFIVNDDSELDLDEKTKFTSLSVLKTAVFSDQVYSDLVTDVNNVETTLATRQARLNDLGAGENLDWADFEVFNKEISANTSLTFSNTGIITSKTIIVAVKNTTGTPYEVTFPVGVLWPDGSPIVEVAANTTSIFTFVKVANDIYATSVQEMS